MQQTTNTTQDLISVIIPTYNVEEYLVKCLDSVLSQSYQNLEILLINDGSTDNSGKICDEYMAKDSRIKVFHLQNGGVANARKHGYENSTGEYLVFVDPDDYMPSHSIETLKSNLTEEFDMVIGGYIKGDRNDFEDKNIKVGEAKIYDDILTDTLVLNFQPTPWAKIYRKNLFTINSFPDFRRSQDWLMFIDISTRVGRVKQIPDYVYYYRRSSNDGHQFSGDPSYCRSFILKGEEILKRHNKRERYNYAFMNFSVINLLRIKKRYILKFKKDAIVTEILGQIDKSKLIGTQRKSYYKLKYYTVFLISHLLSKFRKFIKKIKQ